MILSATLTVFPGVLYMAKESHALENTIFGMAGDKFEVLSSEFKVTELERVRNRIQSS